VIAGAGAREPLVEVRDLEVRLGDRRIAAVPALTLRPAECVAIVGESGSGKTTTLLALLALLGKDFRVSGSVRVCGIDMVAANPAEVATVRGARVALVMQSPQSSLNPTMRLGTLMRRALALHGVTGDEARARMADALTSVGLPEAIGRRYPHQVSGGQAQRFGIAMAVALGAEVIAADEPTSALDVTVQAGVMRLLQRLRDERGMGLLLVSHDLALVSTVADEVLVMRDGDVVESGPSRAVLDSPEHDYTRELLAAVPTLGATR
jgi:peptide/nickel transport system ATP-binding protein